MIIQSVITNAISYTSESCWLKFYVSRNSTTFTYFCACVSRNMLLLYDISRILGHWELEEEKACNLIQCTNRWRLANYIKKMVYTNQIKTKNIKQITNLWTILSWLNIIHCSLCFFLFFFLFFCKKNLPIKEY